MGHTVGDGTHHGDASLPHLVVPLGVVDVGAVGPEGVLAQGLQVKLSGHVGVMCFVCLRVKVGWKTLSLVWALNEG